MPFPREIFLDEETENDLRAYLDRELGNHYMERGGHMDDLLRWQSDYWAQPTNERAIFPFDGAATIVIPLSAIAIEAIHARTMMQMFSLPQFVSAHPISNEFDQLDKPIEKFLDRELLEVMKIRQPLGDCFLSAEKFGTMVGKVGYERATKTAVRALPNGNEVEFDVIVKDGAVFDPVHLSRFMMPNYVQDPQMSPWVGEEHTATPYEIRQMELSGKFREGTIIDEDPDDPEKLSKLSRWNRGYPIESTGNKFDRSQDKLEDVVPSFPDTLTWHEVWLGFDVDKTGRDKEIVVHYHKESGTFMSIRYNWNYDLKRPYRVGQYFPLEQRWRGVGICKQNEQFQREVTIQHRQRIDNATLANTRMLVLSKLSDYGPNEPIFPGKMWFVDNVKDHISTLQMGEVYPSSYNNEQATLIYSQQRTGANETMLGMPQVGTPGTATSDLARIQEGNKRFDFWYSNAHQFTDQIINDTACVIQQFGPRQIQYFDTAEHGALIKAYFQMPEELISKGLLIQLKTSSQNYNRILDRQNWQQIAAFLNQYYVGVSQIAQFSGDQVLMQAIQKKAVIGATEAMRQILDSFDIRNIDRIILSEIEDNIRNATTGNVNPNGTVAGGNTGPDGISAPTGMDLINKILPPPQ